MWTSAALGRQLELVVVSLGAHGARLRPELSSGDEPSLLLPKGELPEGVELGQRLDVFVHQDSDDRPIATLRSPKLRLGEVAFLEVVDLAPFGAFFDWGLVKQLLVPHAEQTLELCVGARHPVGLYVDDSGRLAGTMRVSEMLRSRPPYERNDWAEGEAWRSDPSSGVFVILDRKYVGLLPASEPNQLRRGEAARFRVASKHPDGRVEVSLRDLAHRQADDDAATILSKLLAPGAPAVSDKSSPELILEQFGLSKKAFKRAVGGLLKRGEVELDAKGNVVVRR